MKYFQWENVVDTLIFLINMQYLVVLLRKYRYDSFLSNPDPVTEARLYFHQYTESFVNEGLFLWIIGVWMWIKAFNQLKWLRLTGSLHQVIWLLFGELLTFAIFYASMVFIYAIIGDVVFGDLEGFDDLGTAMFTLFRASLQDYDIDMMDGARAGNLLGYAYFNSYLVLNVVLFLNLITA